jgi:uncharacterized membrane protein
MNAAHLHLLLNHLPIFGLMFGTVWLLVAIVLKKNALRDAALLTLFVVAIFTIPAYLTGEGAEEIVEDAYNRNRAALHEHEEAAMPALILTLLAGAAGIVAWVMNYRGKAAFLNWVTLGLAIASIVLMARVGNLGGQVSHPEIGGTAASQTMDQNMEGGEDRDEDGD